jgi:hypothetical protein
MKRKTILLVGMMSLSIFLYAQKFSFKLEGIHTEYVFHLADDHINKRIVMINTTEKSVFIPIISDTSMYHFTIKGSVYSYLGVKTSLLGPPNLGGWVILKELKPADSVVLEITIPYQNEVIDKYKFNIDFITKKALKKVKVEISKQDNVMLKTLDYLEHCKSSFFVCDFRENKDFE